MGKLFRKSRLILSVVLFAQAVTLFVLFILQFAKRKSLAQAFLAVGAFETIAATYLLIQEISENRERKETARQISEMKDNPEGFAIPLDRTAKEKDFL